MTSLRWRLPLIISTLLAAVLATFAWAAHRTVEEGSLHSLHAYFLRPGKHHVPVRYLVYRIRDGRSFTTRDVVAYQSGEM